MANENWAKQQAERIQKGRADRDEATKKSNRDHEIKTTQGPKLWEAVREELKVGFVEFNREMREDVMEWGSVRSDEAVILAKTPDGGVQMRVEYDPTIATVNASGGGWATMFRVEVLADGTPSFFRNQMKLTPKEVASEILEGFARILK